MPKNRPSSQKRRRDFFPEIEDFLTQTKKYENAIRGLSAQEERPKQELDQSKETQSKQKMNKYLLETDYANPLRKLKHIPLEPLRQFDTANRKRRNGQQTGNRYDTYGTDAAS